MSSVCPIKELRLFTIVNQTAPITDIRGTRRILTCTGSILQAEIPAISLSAVMALNIPYTIRAKIPDWAAVFVHAVVATRYAKRISNPMLSDFL
jgi:hypothetical protein